MGNKALGFSSGLEVKVGNEDPGPHRMRAWRPVAGIDTAWGILKRPEAVWLRLLDGGAMREYP